VGANDLLPEHLTGNEGISSPFFFALDLLATPSTAVDPKSIVGSKCCITIQANDAGGLRYINGYVMGLEMYGGDDEFSRYRADIVPNIWLLRLNKNTRVFQDKSVIDIVTAVLGNYNITLSDQTSGSYVQLDYCTQYRETDLDFISRLLEQFGILYYFVHSQDDHAFTIQDTSSSLPDCLIQNTFRYAPQGSKSEGRYDFVMEDFKTRNSMATGEFTSWDHSFVANSQYLDKPSVTTPLGSNSNENYDYIDSAAAYSKKVNDANGVKGFNTQLNSIRAQAINADRAWLASGSSNAICLQPGYTFTLTKHPQVPLNQKYLLNYMELEVQQVPSYRTKAQAEAEPYSNNFKAVPSSMPYKPPLKTAKPVVNGMHTGLVVVQSGEDSYMDKYGRVNVQFWWDRLRKANTPDNTLLRVAQSWAGKGWGTYFWPRIGDEVLIDFIEGDPDQPIVVGSVYNGVNMPKYDPAGQYTLSGILTRSSTGGAAANANELRFEDLAGKEQIFMNAEKDYDLHVEHDWHTLVGNEQHTKITSNQFDEVDGDRHSLVKGKQLEEIDGDAHLNIKGKNIVSVTGDREHTMSGNLKESVAQNSNISVGSNLNEQVGQNYSLTVGMKQVIQAGMNFDVIAPMQISLNCGPNSIVLSPEGIGLNGAGGFISIGPAGVTIEGTLVMINSAGAPVIGSPGSATSPQSPSSPTAPTAPTFPGDAPPSQPASASSSSSTAATAASSSTPSAPAAGGSAPPSPASAPAAAAAGAAGAAGAAAGGAANQAAQGAQQAAAEAKTAASEAQQAATQAEQQAQQAVNQVTQQGRQAYQQANQAVQQAQAAVAQASAQGQAAAQQALSQAEQQAQQTAQQASKAVQQAQQQAQQVQQQAQAAANQAEQQAQQAQKDATQAAAQAQQAGQQAAQQGQQAAQQAQQGAQQAQQQAQQAAGQAQQAAQQAQQQAQQAQKQVTQAASGASQQAQQASQAAQQSAQQAMNSATKGF
jgi:type VI secretion system secreted protein VgrG